jgi:hypothetical protein
MSFTGQIMLDKGGGRLATEGIGIYTYSNQDEVNAMPSASSGAVLTTS